MEKIIVGRKEEIKILNNAMTSEASEFVAVIGRRRVGKTFLIKKICKPVLDFELTGLQSSAKSDQLKNFVYAMQTYFPDLELELAPNSWLEAFFLLKEALVEMDKSEKIVIFLDELPWLATKRSDFLTALGWFWNTWASVNNVMLVICGSAASWMISKVINNKGGLYNRVTKRIFLDPFTLAETEEFFLNKSIRLSRYQITQLYMAIGGIPMYLDQVRPGLSAAQNIQEICFERNGYLRKEFDRLFSSIFDHAERHTEIIRALASKKMGLTRGEIIAKTSLKNGGMLTQILKELSQSGFIKIYNGYGKKKRQSLYRLTDSYSLFYLTFMDPLGANANADFSKMSDLPKYRTWSGYAFENICLTHIAPIRKALGIAGIYTTTSSFYAKNTDVMPGAQIDLIIDRGDNSINLCEIKFSNSEYILTKKDTEALRNKKNAFAYHSKTKKHIFTSLITTFGAVNNPHRINHIDQVVTLDDLFVS